MTKYIVSIAIATTTVTAHDGFSMDCHVEPLVVDDGTGQTQMFDSWTEAAEAWKNARSQYRESALAEGWTDMTSLYEGDFTLELSLERGGVRSDRIITASVISVPASEKDSSRRLLRPQNLV